MENPLPRDPGLTLSGGSSRKLKKLTRRFKKAVTKRKNTIEDIARETVLYNCNCKEPCLATVGSNFSESTVLMTEYITPWMNMTKKEHQQKFFSILEGCVRGVTVGGHLDKRSVIMIVVICYAISVETIICHRSSTNHAFLLLLVLVTQFGLKIFERYF